MLDSIIFDPLTLIKTAGYLGILGFVFAESGLFFGFFLPGDSLLFTAGLLASQGYLNIWLLIIALPIAAILGDNVGYWFGQKVGPLIFTRPDSWLFNKKHLERTRLFYEKYGSRAVVLARFVPIVRTFTPILAGVGEMRYKTFLTYNIIGGILWTLLMTLLGYFLGNIFPNIEKYLVPIIVGIIFVSFIPIILEFRRNKNK
ncbi:MAG: VTT domain-containing protein [bacterium]|nr:VTT domain-containing protein [bacterium]